MSLYRAVIPVTRQIRVLGGVFYQNKSFSLYTKEPFNSKTVNFDRQSVLLPGPERIRASALTDNPSQVVSAIPGSPEVKTIYDLLLHGMKISNDGPCMGSKLPGSQSYEWSSYSKVVSRTKDVGSGLIELGLKPTSESYVGIFAANREEFMLTLFACSGYSMVLVPLYPSLGLPSVIYIIQHAKLSVVITTNHQNTISVLNNAKDLPSLKTLVTCEEPTEEHLKLAKAANIRILTYSELEKIGEANRKELVIPKPDELFCIPFTSGTTGPPKGAMLSHGNAISCVASLVYGYGKAGKYGGAIISYLPPAHVYELCNQFASLYFARAVAFYNGDIKNVMQEVYTLKPTILPLVPKVMNNIYLQTMNKIKESKIKSALLPVALWYKERMINRGKTEKKTFFDKYIFNDFQKMIGYPHMVFTTSAPASLDVARFFVLASGAYIFEVYGSTEVFGNVMTLPNDTKLGYVGPPMTCNHVKLMDVPEMGYFSKDDTGEICIRGCNVFKGYLNNPQATNEALKDGWYHTGDVGKWMPNGALKIIDRKKHLFKLSQGEYIAPEKVENIYGLCNLIVQILIDGLSDKDYIVALVVPEPTLLKKWLTSKGYNSDNLKELLASKEVRRDFLLELHKYGRDSYLNSLEQARNMAFLSEPFTIDNDLLTPTLKMKRNVAKKRFEQLYHKLYEEGQIVPSAKS